MEESSGLVELMQRRAQLKKQLRNWTKKIKETTGKEPSQKDCENNRPVLAEYQQVKLAIEKLINSKEETDVEEAENPIKKLPTSDQNSSIVSPAESWFSTTTASFGGIMTSIGLDPLLETSSSSSSTNGQENSWLTSFWNDIPTSSFGEWFEDTSSLPSSSPSPELKKEYTKDNVLLEDIDDGRSEQPGWFNRWVDSKQEIKPKQQNNKKFNDKKATINKTTRPPFARPPSPPLLSPDNQLSPPLPPPSSPPPSSPSLSVASHSKTTPIIRKDMKEQDNNNKTELLEEDPNDKKVSTTMDNKDHEEEDNQVEDDKMNEDSKVDDKDEEDDDEEEEDDDDDNDEEKQKIKEQFGQIRDEAILKFNLNAKKGIAFILEKEIMPKHPKYIADFLFNTKGLNKTQIGEYLGDPSQFNLDVLQCICCMFDFKKVPFSVAIRKFLKKFRIPGEAQKIDRILEAFAETYYRDNKKKEKIITSSSSIDDDEADKNDNDDENELFEFASSSTAHILAFSIIMLNTDAHNPSMSKKNKMTKEQFIRNNRGIDDGKDLKHEILEDIYDDIFTNEILTSIDETDPSQKNKNFSEIELFTNPMKEGWMDKMGGHMGATLLQQWRSRYFILSGNRLFYFKAARDTEPLGCIVLMDVIADVSHNSAPSSSSSYNLNHQNKRINNQNKNISTNIINNDKTVINATEWSTNLAQLIHLVTSSSSSSHQSAGRRGSVLGYLRTGRSSSIIDNSNGGGSSIISNNSASLSKRSSFLRLDSGLLNQSGVGRSSDQLNEEELSLIACKGKHVIFKGDKLGLFLRSRGRKQLPIVDDIIYDIPLLNKGDVLISINGQSVIDMKNPIGEIICKIHEQQHHLNNEPNANEIELDETSSEIPIITLSFIDPATELLIRKHSASSFGAAQQESAVVYSEAATTVSSNAKGYLEIVPSFGGKINSVRYNEQRQLIPGSHDTIKLQTKSTRLAESWVKAINEATIHSSGAI